MPVNEIVAIKVEDVIAKKTPSGTDRELFSKSNPASIHFIEINKMNTDVDYLYKGALSIFVSEGNGILTIKESGDERILIKEKLLVVPSNTPFTITRINKGSGLRMLFQEMKCA